MLDTGTNFISHKFENFCKELSIQYAVSLSYNHQTARQAEACITFVKESCKKCFETNADIIYGFVAYDINTDQPQITHHNHTPVQ